MSQIEPKIIFCEQTQSRTIIVLLLTIVVVKLQHTTYTQAKQALNNGSVIPKKTKNCIAPRILPGIWRSADVIIACSGSMRVRVCCIVNGTTPR